MVFPFLAIRRECRCQKRGIAPPAKLHTYARKTNLIR
jgi:hypothetical protein